MDRSHLITILFVVSCIGLHGQGALERSALNNLEKGKWEACKQKLMKINRKDSISAGGNYVWARYFITEANPEYDIDSAHLCISASLYDFEHTPTRQREKLEKLPLDSMIILQLSASIDSAAFLRALSMDSEEGYIYFIKHYPQAVEVNHASDLRDKAAYREAVRVNTYEAYANFLSRYPKSIQAHEANVAYQKLLYESRTSDRRLASYEAFVKQYPNSPHRSEAEQQIMEISTADGDPDSFRKFITLYPTGSASKKALNILFYLDKEITEDLLFSSNDSLMQVTELSNHYIVPFWEEGKIGFMNDEGAVIISPQFVSIDDAYLCGNINEELLVVDGKIITRSNVPLYQGPLDEWEELPVGFILIEKEGCSLLLHKSGFTIGPACLADGYILDNRFVITRQSKKMSIYTLTGRLLFDDYWDDVKMIGDLIGLKKQDKWILVTPHLLGMVADQKLLEGQPWYDEVKAWSGNQVWVKKNNKEGILNSDLSVSIPVSEDSLQKMDIAVVAKVKEGKKLFNLATGRSSYFHDISMQGNRLAAKKDARWQLIDSNFNNISQPYDTIKHVGSFPLGQRNDSTWIIFKQGNTLLANEKGLKFVPGKDSTYFLQENERNKNVLYDANGNKLFECRCEELTYAGAGFFVYHVKNKKGLIYKDGRVITKPIYDAIGEVEDGRIPLLNKMKFGFYSVAQDKELKPMYDKNLVFLNNQWIAAFQDGKYGILNQDLKAITPFVFDEVKVWNDSAVLVRQNREWAIYKVQNQFSVIGGFSKISFIRNDTDKLAIVKQDNAYGVISSTKGIIIPINFTDIVNIGSDQKPLYFTEKHVPEASIFVIIYYNDRAEVIRKLAMDADSYDDIYCSQK